MKGTTALYFGLVFIQCISFINGNTDDIKITPDEFFAVKDAMNFRGKVVLVTGSSSGIGAATVRLFSYLGAQVVVTGRNVTRINEVVHDCWELSPGRIKPLGIKLDLSINGNVGRLVNETIQAYQKIDILVNNVGVGNFASIKDPNYNRIHNDLRTINVEAPMELTRSVIPYIESTNGSIIFIASILARNPVQTTAGYSMGKNAIIALAKTLCLDLGPNVRVNVISPGIVDGTRIFRLLNPNPRPFLIANSIASSTLRRPGVPMDIAKTVVFLASPLAGFVNSQELHLDGGAYYPIS